MAFFLCLFHKATMSKKEPRDIDGNKGYRIEIRTLEHSSVLPSFKQAHTGTPRAQSVFVPNDPDLKDRETKTVHSLADLLNIMQTGDAKRIAEAAVIFNSHEPVAWKRFFIPARDKDDGERLSDLFGRVGKIRGGDPVPCTMLFEARENKRVGTFSNKRDPHTGLYKGSYRDVFVKGRTFMSGDEPVRVDLRLSYLINSNYQDVFTSVGDLYLVMGMASNNFNAQGISVMEVNVDHRDAMRKITAKELTTPPPAFKPTEPTVLTYEMLGKLD